MAIRRLQVDSRTNKFVYPVDDRQVLLGLVDELVDRAIFFESDDCHHFSESVDLWSYQIYPVTDPAPSYVKRLTTVPRKKNSDRLSSQMTALPFSCQDSSLAFKIE